MHLGILMPRCSSFLNTYVVRIDGTKTDKEFLRRLFLLYFYQSVSQSVRQTDGARNKRISLTFFIFSFFCSSSFSFVYPAQNRSCHFMHAIELGREIRFSFREEEEEEEENFTFFSVKDIQMY